MKQLGHVNGPHVALGSSVLSRVVEAVADIIIVVVVGVLIKGGVVIVVFFVASSFGVASIFGRL